MDREGSTQLLGACSSPLLYKQNMHRSIRNDNKHPRDHPQPDHIPPQRLCVEPECTEDRRSRNLDVQAVFVVDQRQERHFVDNERLESVVEDGQLSVELASDEVDLDT